MLEGLAAWILRTYVGEYVENLNTEQLSIGYGGIELENLTLKKNAFKGLEIPLRVKSGFIGKLKLEIPFRNPKSQPWIICIDKLYIIAGPNHDVLENYEERERQRELYKQQQLEANEKEWRASRDKPGGSWWSESWWPSLYSSFSTTVVENLQLVITDVCFRYESFCPRLKKSFALGISIGRLSAQSTNEDWEAKFLYDGDELKFKAVELDELSIYWDNDVTITRDLSSQGLKDFFKAPKKEKERSSRSEKLHDYILQPVSGKARIRRNSRTVPLTAKDGPRFFIELLLEKIPLSLSDRQYAGMIDLVETFQSYFLAQKYIRWRPTATVKESPLAWWTFAIQCHMHNIRDQNQRRSKNFIMERVTDIILYSKTYREHLTHPHPRPETEEVKKAIEAKLSFEELKNIRSYVTAKIVRDDSIKRVESSANVQKPKEGENNSWGSWLTSWAWSGYTSTGPEASPGLHLPPEVALEKPVTKEEEEFLDELTEGVQDDSLFKRDYMFVQLHFKLASGSFQLRTHPSELTASTAIAELEFSDLSWKSEIRPKSGTWEFCVTLGALYLRDLQDAKSIFPVLIQPQEKRHFSTDTKGDVTTAAISQSDLDPDLQPSEETPLLEVVYEQRPLGDKKLHKLGVSMQPLNVVYNPLLVRKLSNFSPAAKSKYKLRMSMVDTQIQKMARARYEEFKSMTKVEFIKAVDDLMSGETRREGDRWDTELNLSAPRVIVPDGFHDKETSMVIFDLGRISFMNAPAIERQKRVSENDNAEEEDSDEFLTPCSTPPDEQELAQSITSIDFSDQTDFVENLKQRFYQRYHFGLSDLQVIVCKVKENWSIYQRRGTSHLHLVDRFSISLEMERRLVFSADPNWPGVTVSGSLPSLMVHVDENKMQVLYACLDQAKIYGSMEKPTTRPGVYSPDLSSKDNDSLEVSEASLLSENSVQEVTPARAENESAAIFLSPRKDVLTFQNRAKELLIESRLLLTQFKFDEISLSLHSRGRCVAELRFSGVEAEYTKRPYDFSACFTLHSLLLVDAIQTYGPEYELLIASHPDVHVFGPQEKEGKKDQRKHMDEALIQLHYQQVDRDCPSLAATGQQSLRIASIQCNSLDIIANQETIVELMNVIKHAIPGHDSHIQSSQREHLLVKQASISSAGSLQDDFQEWRNQEKLQVEVVFQRANLILVRGAMDGQNDRIGRKVAAITAADLEFSASFNDEHVIRGSLGGLRVMDLTPDAYLHQCIVSLGECLPGYTRNLTHDPDENKAFRFSYTKPTGNPKHAHDAERDTKVDVHMASAYYMHSGQFLAELNLCMGDFKDYAKSMAKSLQTAATDMAIGLVKRKHTFSEEATPGRAKTHSYMAGDPLEFLLEDIEEEQTKPLLPAKRLLVKVCVETPVVVLPKVHNSTELLVANLGRIVLQNQHLSEPTKEYHEDATENTIDRLFVNITDMSLYSLVLAEDAKNTLLTGTRTTFDVVQEVSPELRSLSTKESKVMAPLYLVHDTGIKLTIDNCSSRSATDGLALRDNGKEPSLALRGEITSPVKATLRSSTYKQLIETLDSLPPKYDKIPRQVRPEVARLPISSSGSSLAPSASTQRTSPLSPRRSKSYEGNFYALDGSQRESLNSSLSPVEKDRSFTLSRGQDPSFQQTTPITASFKVPRIQIELGGELGGKEHGFVDITLEEFSLAYNNLLGSVTEMDISLGGLIVEDLLHEGAEEYKYLVSSRSVRSSPTSNARLGPRLSSSCPESSTYIPYEALSCSLPSVLPRSPGKYFPRPFSPLRPMLGSRKFPSQPHMVGVGESEMEDADDVDERYLWDIKEDQSLVKVKISTVDTNSREFLMDPSQINRTMEVTFNTLDIIINLQTWVVVFEFFGIGAPQQRPLSPVVDAMNSESQADKQMGSEAEILSTDAVEPSPEGSNTKMTLSMQSLSLTLNKESYCLARAQVSDLSCQVGLRGPNQDVSGCLGELKLIDMSPQGAMYRERFLTLGNKALEFKFFRFGEPDPDLQRDYDMHLDLQMSSVQYVHTQRFMSELIAFCQHFMQLQEVLGRMRAASQGDEVFAVIGRGARVSLQIEADTPILLLPRSSSSEELVAAYLGQMTVTNAFLPAASPSTVASTLTASRKRDQQEEASEASAVPFRRLDSKGASRLLDCIKVGLSEMEVFTARRREEAGDNRASFGHQRQGDPLMRETCKLDLSVERNLELAFGREVPDMIVAGNLSSVYITLDLSQFGLIMGMLGENLGEALEQFERPSSFLVDPLAQLPESEEVWTTLNLSLELVNVSVEMIPKFTFGEIPSAVNAPASLARFDLVKSKLVYESFSDGSRTIDLVSHDVLLHDLRSKDPKHVGPENVFTQVLQPSEQHDDPEGKRYLQFEVHYLDLRDKTLVTCLFNKSQIILIMDFLMETWNFITRKEENSFRERQKPSSPVEATRLPSPASPSESFMNKSVVTKGMAAEIKPVASKTFELKINITDTQLIVVEDCSVIDTRAVILKTTAVLAWRPQHPSERPLTCSLQSLEVFSCTLANIENTALSIIDPVIVLVELNTRSREAKGLLVAVQSLPNLEVTFQSAFNVRLSYHDVKLFLRITESVKRQISRVVDGQRSSERDVSRPRSPLPTSTPLKYSTRSFTKLEELGFSKAESGSALEKFSGNLNEAALFLAESKRPVVEVSSFEERNESNGYISEFQVHAGRISICVIDDCGNSDIPLTEFIVSELRLRHDLQHTGDGGGGATLMGQYYNRGVSRWEPFIESWKFQVNWQIPLAADKAKSKHLFKIDAPHRLDLNLTSALMHMVQVTTASWTEDYYNVDEELSLNVDGTRTVKKRAPFVPFVLRNRTGCKLSFGVVTTTPSMSLSQGEKPTQSATRSRKRKESSGLHEVAAGGELPFTFASKDKLRHKATHELKLHQVIVQVEGWQEMSPVSVDQVGEYFRHSLPAAESSGPLQSLRAQPIRVVFAVSLEGARKVVTIRSSLMVVNKIKVPLRIWAESYTEGTGEIMPVLQPDESFPVPLPFVTWSLYVKPEVDGDYDFCKERLQWKEVTQPFEEKGFSGECFSNRSNDIFRFCYITYREGYPEDQPVSLADAVNKKVFAHPGHVITITHHLVLVNLLPVELSIVLKNESKSQRIKAGKSVPLHMIDAKQPFDIAFTFESYSEVHFQRISAKYRSDDVVLPITCHDSRGRPLVLHLKIEHDVIAAKISVFVPYWLVNKTGLPLVFRREGEAEECAGQFEEHEKARSLTPLLFSFIDEESSTRCQMRVGNEYYPDSSTGSSSLAIWSTPFSPDVEQDHKTLYVKQGRYRPERAYDIGVDVQSGQGPFSCTRVVSFVTRFQLENRSQHRLAFAQRHLVKGQMTKPTENTIVSPSGAITLFHWARSDLDQLLCVRLENVEHCRWSGGFRINAEDSFHVNMRSLIPGVCFFIRVDVVLRGATFQVIFTDAHQLPTPYRIDNMSEVEISFWQENCVDVSLRTVIKPKQSLPYAMDELTLEPKITVSVFDQMSETYHMTKKEDYPMLYYENPIYITFTHTFRRNERSRSSCEHRDSPFIDDAIRERQLVLDVDEKHRVFIGPKIPHRRSQLWRMTHSGLLRHVGSSSPFDPRKRGPSSDKNGYFLDVDLNHKGEHARLFVNPHDKKRANTQTWSFEGGKLTCCFLGSVVQPLYGIEGLVEGGIPVLEPANILTYHGPPIWHCVSSQKLRPGSGVLLVKVVTDGPTRVLRITDHRYQNPEEDWMLVEFRKETMKSTRVASEDEVEHSVEINFSLAGGIGISLVNHIPEEIVFVTLSQIEIECSLDERNQSLELSVGNAQVDNQLFGSQLPVLLYPTPVAKQSGPTDGMDRALQISIRREKSEEYDLEIFRHFTVSVRRLTMLLEDRTLLKLLQFFGFGKPENDATCEEDFNIYESQRSLEKKEASGGKRLYFERLSLGSTEFHVSLAAVGRLTPDLLRIKKFLGVPIVSLEDAVIQFGPFKRAHLFESSSDIWRQMGRFYWDALKGQTALVLGSLDMFGNPMGLLHDVSTGMEALVKRGNLGGLIVNVAHGLSDATAKVTGSIADGLWMVSMDSKYQETRDTIRAERSGSSRDHLAAGFKGFGMGLFGGLTSLVTQPIEGASRKGFQGFLSGLAKGAVGTVTKPTAGILDLASGTAAAVRGSARTRPNAPKPVRLKRNCYDAGGVLPQYSKFMAEGQGVLLKLNEGNIDERFISTQVIRSDSREGLQAIVSSEGTYFVKPQKTFSPEGVLLHMEYSQLYAAKYLFEDGKHFLELIKKRDSNGDAAPSSDPGKRPRVLCESEKIARKVEKKINYMRALHEERQFKVIPREAASS